MCEICGFADINRRSPAESGNSFFFREPPLNMTPPNSRLDSKAQIIVISVDFIRVSLLIAE